MKRGEFIAFLGGPMPAGIRAQYGISSVGRADIVFRRPAGALPSKFQLTVTLKTAKAVGLAVPGMLLTCADEVIE